MNRNYKLQIWVAFFALSLVGNAPILVAKTNESAGGTSSVEALESLNKLKNGNQRFVSGKVRTDGQSQNDIARLSTGQKPHSIVLSCSDSRVPPEIVFDQKLGEIFTVRSAGETLSPTAIASIEFAVQNLGSHLVVVLGHTNCGAVKAAIDTIHGNSAGSDNLDQLVSDIHPRIKSKFDEKNPSKDLKAESWLNAKGVAQDLLKRSPVLSEAVSSGKLKLQVGLYNLHSGVVEFE